MATPKKKKRQQKRKVSIKVTQKAQVVRKDSVRNDTIQKVQGRPPANNGATFKVKLRKK